MSTGFYAPQSQYYQSQQQHTGAAHYNNHNQYGHGMYPQQAQAPPQVHHNQSHNSCECQDCVNSNYHYQQQQHHHAQHHNQGYVAQPNNYASAPSNAGTYTHTPYSLASPASKQPEMPVPPTAHHYGQSQEHLLPPPPTMHHASQSHDTMSNGSIGGPARRDSRTESHSSDYSGSDEQEQQVRHMGPTKVSMDNLQQSVGHIVNIAGSPHGSSFLQLALRQYPIEAFEIIYKEVFPQMQRLFQDKYACYVIKMLLEMMEKEEAITLLLDMCSDNDSMMLSLCTKDLHTRRMVQFVLDFMGDTARFLFDLVMRRPMDIVRTQQGCITMQRILDAFPQDREQYFATVRANFMEYTLDPFGNYIIQYMLAEGSQVENSSTLALYCRGQLHNMICHKYASNVIEKCFGLVTPELQHEIVEEMFNAPEPTMLRMLNDSVANYVVQAAIRCASHRDVTMISQRLTPLMQSIPFGRKLQQRLQRRLGGQ